MKITKGSKNKKINKRNQTSIIDITFDNKYTIYVFQGSITANDIIIKYAEEGKRVRTPKHIHWAVDLLLKLQAEEKLTKEFIKEMKQIWENCKQLKSNDEQTLTNLVNEYLKRENVFKYEKLNKYGEYNMDFLTILMILLMNQEKANNKDAFMFGKVLDALLKEDLDIFAVMSAAGFGGRK